VCWSFGSRVRTHDRVRVRVETFRVSARQESHKLRDTHCPRVFRVRVETSSRTNGSRIALSLFPFDFSCAPFPRPPRGAMGGMGAGGGRRKRKSLATAYRLPDSFRSLSPLPPPPRRRRRLPQGNSGKIFRRFRATLIEITALSSSFLSSFFFSFFLRAESFRT